MYTLTRSLSETPNHAASSGVIWICLCAGIGEMVLVTADETTQHALDKPSPIDAYIVGIVDAPPQMGK